MTDVATQTADILINGIPFSEFIKNNTVKSDISVWDFLKDNSDTEHDTDSENENANESNNVDVCTSISPSLSEQDVQGLRESILYCIDESVRNNPLSFSDPTFHIKLENSIYEIIEYTFSDNLFTGVVDIFRFTEDMENQIEEVINTCLEEYFENIVPPRSYPTTCILQPPNVAETIKKI
jgi:hypothetical protein